MTGYLAHLVSLLAIRFVTLTGLRWTLRWGGMVVLCQASLVGVGAYTYALCAGTVGAAALPAAAVVGGAASLPLGAAAVKGGRRAVALASLCYQMLVVALFRNLESVTGGAAGISAIAPLRGASPVVAAALWGVPLAVIAWRTTALLERSGLARRLRAAADDPVLAASLGVDPLHGRALPLVLAGALAGLAGGLYAARFGFIDPTAFALHDSLMLFAASVIALVLPRAGEAGAAVFVVALPELLRILSLPPGYAANVQTALFGLSLVVLASRFRDPGAYA